jgi:two-component system, cell cycle sensor histidine kinase and response regulator CckA
MSILAYPTPSAVKTRSVFSREKFCIQAARCCSGIMMLSGLSGLIGWMADIPVLAQPSAWLSPMSLITAILLSIGSLAILSQAMPSRRRLSLLSGALGALILAIGAWTLLVYLFGGSLPFDSWLLDRGAASGLGSRLNRMSPVSALCFTLFGAAVVMTALPRPRSVNVAQAVEVFGLLFALVSLIGYLYSIAALIDLRDYKPIAPQTALALLLSFLGLVLATPDRGVMRIVLSDEIGGLMARRLLFFVMALPVLLGGVASAGLRQGLFNGPMSVFFLTATMVLSLAGLLLFNAFTINRSEQGRRAVQRSLEESERAYRTLFENAADPMFLVDRDLDVLEANAAAAACLETPVSGLKGRRLNQLSPACSVDMEARLKEAFTSGSSSFETCGCTPSKRDVPMEIHARATEFRGRQTVLIIARDLSERRRAERMLAEKEALLGQAQKMEAIGRLAGGVAHDFNNLLTVMMGYADLLMGKLPEGSDERGEAFEIKMCAMRAAALTRQLLTFSRHHAVTPKSTRMNAVIDGMTPLLGRLIGEKIRLDIRLRAQYSSIRIDPNQLEQVVLNLAVNARDAMPEGGTLTIESRETTVNGELTRFTPAPASGRYVELVVQDTGPGIPPEVEPHIFEPFFTTKGESQGTGLGLSTVYGIVTQNSGAVGVESSARTGTAMRMLFPLVGSGDEEEAAEETPHGGTARLFGTILIVEDERLVRDYLSQGLRQSGYNVLEAESGDAALRLLDAYKGAIDVVVSDVVMQGMSGLSLGEQIVRRLPGTRVVFMSGYDVSQSGEIGPLCGRFDLITKPFTVPDLVSKLRNGGGVQAVSGASR